MHGGWLIADSRVTYPALENQVADFALMKLSMVGGQNDRCMVGIAGNVKEGFRARDYLEIYVTEGGGRDEQSILHPGILVPDFFKKLQQVPGGWKDLSIAFLGLYPWIKADLNGQPTRIDLIHSIGATVRFKGYEEPTMELFGPGTVRSIGSGAQVSPLVKGLEAVVGDSSHVLKMMEIEKDYPGLGKLVVGDSISQLIISEMQAPAPHPGMASVNHQLMLGTLTQKMGHFQPIMTDNGEQPLPSIGTLEEYESVAPQHGGEAHG